MPPIAIPLRGPGFTVTQYHINANPKSSNPCGDQHFTSYQYRASCVINQYPGILEVAEFLKSYKLGIDYSLRWYTATRQDQICVDIYTNNIDLHAESIMRFR